MQRVSCFLITSRLEYLGSSTLKKHVSAWRRRPSWLFLAAPALPPLLSLSITGLIKNLRD